MQEHRGFQSVNRNKSGLLETLTDGFHPFLQLCLLVRLWSPVDCSGVLVFVWSLLFSLEPPLPVGSSGWFLECLVLGDVVL